LAAARESDPHAVTEASLVRFEQMIFDALVGGEELTPDELAKIAQAMRSGMGSRKDLVAMRQKQSEAVKEAEQAVEAGKSAPDVVATIKKALGISAAA
ncbi:MAG TPA: hypothetical protein PLD59_15915, partial [Tepidisphaeraceae bacterium]|nr:hypothetical protein [Tepidisphaeraceae bacterium]